MRIEILWVSINSKQGWYIKLRRKGQRDWYLHKDHSVHSGVGYYYNRKDPPWVAPGLWKTERGAREFSKRWLKNLRPEVLAVLMTERLL